MRSISIIMAAALAAACAGEDTAGPTGLPPETDVLGRTDGSRAVTQGGAQDIAHFRSIVARGDVPGVETLDPVGFFAEHALDLPPADCGEDICLHPMLAVAPRFDGGNWTMAFVAMNTPVDPATLARPPLHVVLALERTTRTIDSWRALQIGARVMVSRLRDKDRISVVVFGDRPTIVAQGVTKAEVDAALLATDALPVYEGAALYDGLATAGQLAADLPGWTDASRMLLVTSGHATAGIADAQRVLGVAEAYARMGIPLNVIGIGEDYREEVPRALGDLGIGNYAYAQDAADLDQILRFEGDTTLFPLATEFAVAITAAPGYRVGRVWGARRATRQSSHAKLESPALFIGHREGASDVGSGRRGGGGGLFVELVADETPTIGAGAPAFTIAASWVASDGRAVEVTESVVNTLAPGQNPDGMWPAFSADTTDKAFMMVNMFLALRASIDFYEDGDCSRAIGTYELVAPTVELWQEVYDDPDTWADLALFGALRTNMDQQCRRERAVPTIEVIEPVNISSGCMML